MFDNAPEETQYFYTDDDSKGAPLDGRNRYEITFSAGALPPVNGFLSLTLYNEHTRSRSTRAPNRPEQTKSRTGCLHRMDRSHSTFAPIGAKRLFSTARGRHRSSRKFDDQDRLSSGCLLVALSGHSARGEGGPLLPLKRTFLGPRCEFRLSPRSSRAEAAN